MTFYTNMGVTQLKILDARLMLGKLMEGNTKVPTELAIEMMVGGLFFKKIISKYLQYVKFAFVWGSRYTYRMLFFFC